MHISTVAGLAGLAVALSAAQSAPAPLWTDATAATIGVTADWTNKVEIGDVDGDGRPDLLFANGGNYSDPGKPESSRVFLNRGAGQAFREATAEIFKGQTFLSRVIKVRDVNGDGRNDIIVGATYQTQTHLLLNVRGTTFDDVTATHLPQVPLSVGDLEPGDVDGDGDLDLVLADWGPGNNMTNAGGRTRLWLNDGTGHFTDATASKMPDVPVRFSWDLELVDYDNDFDLDILVSSKRGGGGALFKNDGAGTFTDASGALPAYTNNYEYEPMDLDGDGFLDLVTINDGEILNEQGANRREHVFRNDGKGRFRDATPAWWPAAANIGEDDNVVAYLDVDSDGDPDFLVGSLSGPDRLLLNDGKGHLTLAPGPVLGGKDTPGTLGMALADLDGDHRIDVVMGQGEDPQATDERVFLGTGLKPDTAAPVVGVPSVTAAAGGQLVRVRVHDRKSPSISTDWSSVDVRWTEGANTRSEKMTWYGEYLWRATVPAGATAINVCATDAAGNKKCATR